MSNQPTPWQIAADEVLACMLRDVHLWSEARFEWAIREEHFPPGAWRDVFRAVDELHTLEEPVHITALVDKCDGRANAEWIGQRMVAYSPAMKGDRFRSSVHIMKSRAEAYANITAMDAASKKLRDAPDEDTRRAVVGEVITQLNTNVTDTIQSATAADVGARFLELMASEPEPVITTGLSWLDNNTGGFQRGQIWWIAAAYKMRKSTLMRNMILGAARSGASITVALREGTQPLLVAQLVAMMAVERLYQQGAHDETDAHGIRLVQLSASQLLRLRNRYKTALHPKQVAAISEASREFVSWGKRLRIYDPAKENGGLSTFGSLKMIIHRDLQMHGIDLCFVDYFQLLQGNKSSVYENTAYMAQEAQALAVQHNFCMVMLAQLNEESVKGNNDSHSPGVKGGGDPAATADYLLTTGYPKNSDDEPVFDTLRIGIRLARHGESRKYRDIPMNPASGLLLLDNGLRASHTQEPVDFGGEFAS